MFRGVKVGDRVLLLLDLVYPYIDVYLGAARMGAVVAANRTRLLGSVQGLVEDILSIK